MALLKKACAAVLLLAVVPGLRAGAGASREYQIKAAFLFHFAQFVKWPEAAFSNPQAPFVIGILGNDPFGASLDEAVKGETEQSHPLVVHRYSRVEDAAASQILFISGSEDGRIRADLAALKSRSVLTVGDAEDFSRDGGVIRFVTEDNRIRLRINLSAAKAASLSISSMLLRPSEIVREGGD